MKCKLLVAEDELIEHKVLCRTLQKYLGDLICLYEAKKRQRGSGNFCPRSAAGGGAGLSAQALQRAGTGIRSGGCHPTGIGAAARPAQPPAPAQSLRREEDEDMRTAIIRAEISRFIDAHYGEDISMQDAAAALRYSDAYFCKLFKQCFKVNFSVYLNEYRVNKARQLILDPRLSLKDIGAAVGYSDANYFTRVLKRLTGQIPSEYRVAAAEKAVQR